MWCINCIGDHTAVSFNCPNKKTAHQQQNPKTPLAPTQTKTYATATTTATTVIPAPSPAPTQSDSSTEKQTLYDYIINYSFRLSNGDLESQTDFMNDLLKYNNFPTVKISPNFHQKIPNTLQANQQQKHTRTNICSCHHTHTNNVKEHKHQ